MNDVPIWGWNAGPRGRQDRPRHLQQPLPSNIAGTKKGPYVVVDIERTFGNHTQGRSVASRRRRECASE